MVPDTCRSQANRGQVHILHNVSSVFAQLYIGDRTEAEHSEGVPATQNHTGRTSSGWAASARRLSSPPCSRLAAGGSPRSV